MLVVVVVVQVHVSLFVASAAFGDVHVSLCVAGAALVKFMCHFSWQAQHLVKLMCHFSWQVQHLVKFMCHFLWQAQHLVKLMCHFSWQVQHVVKFGMIAGAGNVVIFNRICSWRVRKVASVRGGLRFAFSGSDHSRIILGSCSDRGRIMVGSVAHWKCHFSCFQLISLRFGSAILRGRRSIW